MKKWKFFLDLDKEEKWLNEMAKQGWILARKSLRYKFERGEEKLIKIDYRTFKSKKDLEDYLLLFEDSGWTHLAGDKSSGRQYFMKEDSNANDDIFSDQRSKAERYKRMADGWLNLAISYIPIAVTLYLTKFADFESILNPKSLYLTPGLWELTGLSFWKAFLFETPFAFGRGFAWSIFPVLIILYIIFAIKARVEYKKFTS
ncbi:MAG TPA: DUF2812 domain-containing protein, partial [Candidatus Tetragenococcus pullicola]|nr:DUF2812 domain-containing protein [Candidatus Tetragenococcus pullicola]